MEQTNSNQGTGNNEIRNGVDQSAARASSAAHQTVDRVANAARPAVDRLAQTAHQTVDKVSSIASSAADTLQQKREQLMSSSGEWVDDARGYVRANPMAAVGIAAAVGFVLSRLLKSR